MAPLPLIDEEIPGTTSSRSAVQLRWSQAPIRTRLTILRSARHILASRSSLLVDALPQGEARTRADSLAAEVLPLLAACRYLERNAPAILATRRLGLQGRPVWLPGVASQIERVPFGTILVIGPANYPLFLPGVQVLQALAAGNAVVWKPGSGGRAVALVMQQALHDAGLCEGLLRVTADDVAAAETELAAQPDKVVFTGSHRSGRSVLQTAMAGTIPVVAELSGCDAVVALPSADAARLVDALAFGMRLNASATCMAPRRLIFAGEPPADLLRNLIRRFSSMPAVKLAPAIATRLADLLADAQAKGAVVHGALDRCQLRPIIVVGNDARIRLGTADIFAPVLMVLEAPDAQGAIALSEAAPQGLTLAIFGNEAEARSVARTVTVGTVLINDLIVPTADPRVPFGGRKSSGFGTTRGAEGLLEMTAPRVLSVRRGRNRRHYEATGPSHEELFDGIVLATHGAGWSERLRGLRRIANALRHLGTRNKQAGETRS